jgi:hypothetical protein
MYIAHSFSRLIQGSMKQIVLRRELDYIHQVYSIMFAAPNVSMGND